MEAIPLFYYTKKNVNVGETRIRKKMKKNNCKT